MNPTGGILSPQQKVVPNSDPGDYMPAQVDQLRTIAGTRKWDITFLSIGGNDVGLSPIVKTCLINDVIGPGNCYNRPIGGEGPELLYEVVDHSLSVLRQRFVQMAPCFDAKGGALTCKTVKIVNNAPATSPTPSKPTVNNNIKHLMQVMYPDLTQQPNGNGGTKPCTVGTPPQSPMNPIDNTWAYGALYNGVDGKPVNLPTHAQFPQYPAADPNPVVPTEDGLLPQLRGNRATYGWRLGLTMYKSSHPYGVCAPQRWEYGITDVRNEPVDNLSGALHPNDSGQAQYADMLGPVGIKLGGLPVKR